ncbi:DUF6053 domain-containing protein [Lysobacter gummosus]|uniref:DUF6053 domain-containing protein n=1 Tax=Lysobacter gummosus TaxID=262324 RepID=UPI001C9DAFDE
MRLGCGFAASGSESIGAEAPPTKDFVRSKHIVGGASAPMLSVQCPMILRHKEQGAVPAPG